MFQRLICALIIAFTIEKRKRKKKNLSWRQIDINETKFQSLHNDIS
jgi:hypothetical protein